MEALVIQGPKLSTILSQVKKLEVSVLVLSQYKHSPFCWYDSPSDLYICSLNSILSMGVFNNLERLKVEVREKHYRGGII